MNRVNKLIVLYGEPSVGKTTTLKKVFKIITGLDIPNTYNEIRIVFKLENSTIYLATLGDSTSIMDTNFNFFHAIIRTNANVYEYDGNNLVEIDKHRLQQLNPDVCITACRTYRDGTPNDTYNCLCEHIVEDMPSSVKWIAKQQANGSRKECRAVNSDRQTALEIVTEIMNSIK